MKKTENSDGASEVAIRRNLTSKKTMRTVFDSMQPPKKRRKLDLSSESDRLEAAKSLMLTAKCLVMSGDSDEHVWPLLMGAKALESVTK